MRSNTTIPSLILVTLLAAAPLSLSAQSVLVEAKTTAGDEVATIRTDSMRLLVPLHLLGGGLLFPDGTVQTTAATDATSVTSAQIVDGTIVDADISTSAAIADNKLAVINTAGKVANSATTATAVSTPGAIVARNAAGGFETGYVSVGDSLRVRGQGSFLATGTYQESTTAPPPARGLGTRMMWYPEKAAFRAGRVWATQWDGDNIGDYSTGAGANATASGEFSTAFGSNTTASGMGSTALGYYTDATAEGSTALGGGTTASGVYSTAAGLNSVASGIHSTALGSQATANGDYATALGASTVASGSVSTALGNNTNASAIGSTALGHYTTASGNFSAAVGRYTTASGNTSTSMGLRTTAQAAGSVVIGQWNVIEGHAEVFDISTDPLFVAGNGTSTMPANALTLYKSGNLTIAGTLTQNSDARLKEGIEPLEGALERVLQLTPIRYRFRAGTRRPGGSQIGLTAQDVQPLFPELVRQDGDGYLSLSYANLSAVLVKAVQEQQAEIEGLKAEIRSLREARESAEARVARLEHLVRQLLSARTTAADSALLDASR